MTKRILGILFALALLVGLFPATLSIAADSVLIDRLDIRVDTPVDGLKLKTSADIRAYSDYLDKAYAKDDLPVKVNFVAWYPENSGTPLDSGTKATLGTTYTVTVLLEAKEGYAFPEKLQDCAATFNGEVSLPMEAVGNDTVYWIFTTSATAVAAVKGDPVVTVKKVQLSPYEGNPMEIQIEATNGTNIKYQWQITYDSGGWGGTVDLDDNQGYQGCQTPHFRLHSYFGDTFDEDLNFAKVRCKVTSDNGTVYSQEMWYTLLDRGVAESVALTGLDKPVSGKTPDTTLDNANSDVCTVSGVSWYYHDGRGYRPMGTSAFTGGRYCCRIHLTPADAYKFDENTVVTVDGKAHSFITVSGQEATPYGPDTYYVDLEYHVTPIVYKTQATLPLPVAGDHPNNDLSIVQIQGEGYEVLDIDWTDPEGVILGEEETFQAGESYLCILQLRPTRGYRFPQDRAEFSGTVNGQEAAISINHSAAGSYLELAFTLEGGDPEDPEDPEDPSDPEIPDTLLGDVDGDGNITSTDARLTLQFYAGKIGEESLNTAVADVDSDGNITSTDARLILQYYAGKITAWP